MNGPNKDKKIAMDDKESLNQEYSSDPNPKKSPNFIERARVNDG